MYYNFWKDVAQMKRIIRKKVILFSILLIIIFILNYIYFNFTNNTNQINATINNSKNSNLLQKSIIWLGDSAVRFYTPTSKIDDYTISNTKLAVSGTTIGKYSFATSIIDQLSSSELDSISSPDIIMLEGRN